MQKGSQTVAAQVEETLEKSMDYRAVISAEGRKKADATVVPLICLGTVARPFIGTFRSVLLMDISPGFNIRMVSPIVILNYLAIAAEEGILIKDGRALEQINDIDTVVFDKTGTLTLTQPTLGKIYTVDGLSETDILYTLNEPDFSDK